MPVAPTYPGVYIEEIPSGVRTITGVATSITAFIGRALRGPVNDPITINSYGDFERVFGGLWVQSSLGYAVRDFYLNGGSQAIVVRLFHPFFATGADRTAALAGANSVVTAVNAAATAAADDTEPSLASIVAAAHTAAIDPANNAEPRKTAAKTVENAVAAAKAQTGATRNSLRQAAADSVGMAAPITKAKLTVDNLTLEAASEGEWGNKLRARVDRDVVGTDPNLFNLYVRDDQNGQIETFRNVSVTPGAPRLVDKVLLSESNLARVSGTLPAGRPAASGNTVDAGKTIWDDNGSPTNSKVANTDQASNGSILVSDDFIGSGIENAKQGLYALRKADLFNLLCIPPYLATDDVDNGVTTAAAAYCEKRRAMLLVDSPVGWNSKDNAKSGIAGGVGTTSKNAVLYFPRLMAFNPLRDNQLEAFVPCGAVAGIMSRTDSTRGVWKAPAGLDAVLVGVQQLSVPLTDAENGELNPLGINCLRSMVPAGRVVWGSRTLQGDDRLASEWKYVPVRRTALYIEESLYRGTQWVVFEPNDEPLWSQIRLNIGAFMHNLFRQGAFQGTTPKDAYFVKCDHETTTQNDINLGVVNIVVGFAPLKPAEFVIVKIQQIAGAIET